MRAARVWRRKIAGRSGKEDRRPTGADALPLKRRQNRPWPERLNVLDGCEHLTAACSTLAGTLLAECSEVAVLPAFRESLSVPGACDDHGAEARRELGPDGAVESYNAGSRLSLEEAIELVLAEPVTGF